MDPGKPEPLQEDWNKFVDPTQRGTVTKVARQSPGFVMKRYVPERIRANQPPICAEARPWSEVETKGADYQRNREKQGKPRVEGKYMFPPRPKSPEVIARVGERTASRIDVHPLAEKLFDNATSRLLRDRGNPKE